jgi:hypothetical protein
MARRINENVHRREGKDVEEKQSADRRKYEAPLQSMPEIEEAGLLYTNSGTKAETSATVYVTADRSTTVMRRWSPSRDKGDAGGGCDHLDRGSREDEMYEMMGIESRVKRTSRNCYH